MLTLLLTLSHNYSNAQTPTGSCGTSACNSLTAFSDCGSSVYKATLDGSNFDKARVKVQVGGSEVKCLGYSVTGGAYSGDWIGACSMSGLQIIASTTEDTYYVKVNTSSNNVEITTSDFACVSCSVGAASSSPTVCANTAITNITHATTSVTGITSSSGLPTGVSASYSSDVLTISGTPTAAGTYNYTIDLDGCDDDATGTITVNAQPTISGSTTDSRCGTGTLAIQATASAGSIEWFAASSGGSSIGSSSSGVNWTTPSISSTATYYAEADDGTCVSNARTAVAATVTANPTISGSVAGSRCNNGTVEIQATASAGTIEWFAASSGGASLGSSSSAVNWTTPSITATTTYYAEALNGSCTSASRTAVTATKNVASAGPAGLTDELFLWLKADAGTGSIGTSWEDQSCNEFDYTTVAGPTVETDGWNYNKVIEIASGGFDAPAGAELGTDWTVFFVSALLASDNNGRLVDGHSGDYLLGYQGGYRNGININGTPSEYTSGIATTSDIEEPHVFTYVRENSGSTIDARVDGDLLKTFTSTNSGSGIRLDLNQGANSSESSDSRIGEFIIFNKELTDSEIRKVEAYLGLKYGIGLSDADGGNGGDYISSSGTTYWDASANSGYNNGVLTIGKDASSALTQKQAQTVDDSLMVFVSTLASTNDGNGGTITNDESFIALGHNGGRLKSNTTAMGELPDGIKTRFDREWKLTNTNFDDEFSIEIEWDSAGAFDINDVRLIVDTDSDLSNGTVYSTSDGITFDIGSIIVRGLNTTIFPKGLSRVFTLGIVNNGISTLPVELLYFEATDVAGKTMLSWETMAEINNDYFIIEKSTDGSNWNEIATIPGAGNSTESIYYTHLDYDPCGESCYYRLTQVDFDGTSEVFKAIQVGGDQEREFSISVSPNPVFGNVNVVFIAPEDGVFDFSVLSQNGQVVDQAQLMGVQGVNQFSYQADLLDKGVYFFIVRDQQGNVTQERVIR